MAKKDKELMDALHSGGVRKKVARDISDAAGTEAKNKAGGPRPRKVCRTPPYCDFRA